MKIKEGPATLSRPTTIRFANSISQFGALAQSDGKVSKNTGTVFVLQDEMVRGGAIHAPRFGVTFCITNFLIQEMRDRKNTRATPLNTRHALLIIALVDSLDLRDNI